MKVIDVEDTPNPDALKFVLDGTLLESGVRQFDSSEAAKGDPLAKALFAISGVQSVFYMGRFVTISKDAGIRWSSIQPQINQAIMENSRAVESTSNGTSASQAASTDNEELLKSINQVLDDHVRPALAGDGGGLEVINLDSYVLTVHYQGACGTCPSSTMGTMMAVQNLLQRMVDPRLRVVSDAAY